VAVARELLERFDPSDPVRLIGVGVAGLERDDSPRAAPASEGDPESEPLTLL
jgi:hypothetical protein